MNITDLTVIGENDAGWRFAVGRIGDRWVGVGLESASVVAARNAFADEGLPVDPGYMHIFPEVCDGFIMGVEDRHRAILMTGAIAQDFEHAFGGVDRWHVPPELRGNPDDFRCDDCGNVGCPGDCADEWGDYDTDYSGILS